MSNFIGTCLVNIKVFSNALLEHGVIATYFDSSGVLKVQVQDINGLDIIGGPDTTTNYEYDGKPWVRTSRVWKGIEVFHVAPVEGGEN